MTSAWRRLCRLDEIGDPGGKGFSLASDAEPREVFVIRTGDEAFGYVNSCPHVGTPLDWRPDQFLSADRRLIQCATHGALFEIATGLCIAGPCKGARLVPARVVVEHGMVYLAAAG